MISEAAAVVCLAWYLFIVLVCSIGLLQLYVVCINSANLQLIPPLVSDGIQPFLLVPYPSPRASMRPESPSYGQ
jgi:hypothetical protein